MIDTSFTMPVMQALEPPHSHSLSAAIGWLELGNLAEARAELDTIPESLQNNPSVLDVRWDICAREKDWPAGLKVASTLIQVAPEIPHGWLHKAYALRRAPGGGLQAAWDVLFPAIEKFPDHGLIPYNLACYACQLNRLDEARPLLKRALALGDKNMMKKMALKDSDLEPLWPEIRDL